MTARQFESQNPTFNAMRNPIRNVSNVFHGMGILDTPQQASSLMATGRFAQSPAAGLQQYAMYPVAYHDVQTARPSRFVLDQTPTRGQGVSHMTPMTPISGGMPIMAPPYNTTPPATPMAMHGDFTSPRTIQQYGRMDSRLDGRRQNAMRVNRAPFYNNAGHHNHVDVNRIRDGIDVRTTVCSPRRRCSVLYSSSRA
jgi:hypothetical protein